MANQAVIVTGAGNGIGLSITTQLLNSSKVTCVVAVDLNLEKLKPLHEKYQDRLYLVAGDVSESSTNLKAVEVAVQHGRSIHALILNAAIVTPIGSISKTPVSEWKKTFDVNFFALLHMIQHAWPYLLENHGSIIMTSTRVCLAPTESWACYACTKSVLNYLCSCIPLEEGRIKCIAVSPGAVDTETMAKARDDPSMSKKMQGFVKGLKEEGKLLKPEQPAAAFVKLVESGIPEDLVGKAVNWDVIVALPN